MSFDAADELYEIADSTTRKAFKSFIRQMKEEFGKKYLHTPNSEGLKRILSINKAHKLPGCIGS